MELTEIILNETPPLRDYLFGFLGWVIYEVYKFKSDKDKDDALDIKFDVAKWFDKEWDNALFSFLLIPVLVYYLDDILALISLWMGKDIPMYEVYYLGCGVLTELIYFLMLKLSKLRK